MLTLGKGDALIVVDVQNDFLPGGSLAVPHGDEVIPVLNRYIPLFRARDLPVIATRDWHPANHCSFRERGGIWPPHCIAGTPGAQFARDLRLPPETLIVSKGTDPGKEAYSGFQGTDLAERLHRLNITRLFVGGLATDYCVLSTVEDGRAAGFQVVWLRDASRAVEAAPGDGLKAEQRMQRAGAQSASLDDVANHR
jgi:nicotinamidase/pyrazinamidase